MNHYPDEKCRCNGWAPGDYYNICTECGDQFVGDKRAWQCSRCAYEVEDMYTAESAIKELVEDLKELGLMDKDAEKKILDVLDGSDEPKCKGEN